MKHIKMLVLALAATLSNAIAANFPSEIPLSPERQEYVAKNLVNYGVCGVQGSTVSGTWIVSKPYAGPKGDLAAVAAMLRSTKLDYSVDPTEKVSSFAQYNYRTPDGMREFNLFFGEKDWNYVKDASGNWIPPADKLVIDNMVFNQLPVEIPGINGAWFIPRDAQGNPIDRIDLSGLIQGNYLVLGAHQSFQAVAGELYVSRNDGSLGIYNLNGTLRQTVHLNHGIDSSVLSIRSAADNASEIAYKAGDIIVTAKYTVDTLATVKLFASGQSVPANVKNVVVSEKKALDANPLGGTSFDPSKPITFRARAGEEWVVIFEKSPARTVATLEVTSGKTPTITKVSQPNGAVNYTASFVAKLAAPYGDVQMGLPDSEYPAIPANSVVIYKNGVASNINAVVVVSYVAPNGASVNPITKMLVVRQGESLVLPVTVAFSVPSDGSDVYGVSLTHVKWLSENGKGSTDLVGPGWITGS